MAASSENENYELVQAEQLESSESAFSDDIISTKPNWKLPPKHLTARSQIGFSLFIVIPAVLTAFVVTALSVLLSQIRLWLPDKDFTYAPYPAPVSNENAPLNYPPFKYILRESLNPISCDFLTASISAFENVFIIDLRSQRHLSFATAKFIDVMWDLMVGQKGRFLLVWISYVVFMDGLARLMETSMVFYQLYVFMVFETSSLISIWSSFKAVFTDRGWRGRAFLTWFGLATLYVLRYSTLMSTATGYVQPSNIRYRMPDDDLIPRDSDKLKHCLLVVNGSAPSFYGGYLVPGPSDKELEQSTYTEMSSKYTLFSMLLLTSMNYPEHTDQDDQDAYNYVKAHNLSLELLGSPELPVVHFDGSNRSSSRERKNWIGVSLRRCYLNETLDPFFDDNAECLASPYYVWGFSSVLLYIILSFQLVWTLRMFMVWLDAQVYSKLCRKRRRMRGSFRNGLDLAEGIRELLKKELCAYSNREIARQLSKSGHGLQFYSTSGTDDEISHIGISSSQGGQRLHLNDGSLYGRPRRDQK